MGETITYQDLNKILSSKNITLFFDTCTKIKKKNLEWLKVYIDELIKKNIVSGNIEFVEFIYHQIYDEVITIEYILEQILDCIHKESINVINNLLVIYCRKGYLEIVKFIFHSATQKNLPIDIHFDEEKPFREACINSHLHVALWLYELSQEQKTLINIRACNDQAFLESSQKKYYNVVGWLASLCSVYKVKVVSQDITSSKELSDLFHNNEIDIKHGNAEINLENIDSNRIHDIYPDYCYTCREIHCMHGKNPRPNYKYKFHSEGNGVKWLNNKRLSFDSI
jgi:hypothetical protein